jgi:PhzF family phenazine biosynthesis protein
MHLPLYQIDAFTDRLFHGNPAAVCPLQEWLPEATMQQIAAENNLAETAFYVPAADGFHIRWFTPVAEVDLCGHATLATAHVLFHYEGYHGTTIRFDSRSGVLHVRRDNDLLILDFPADEYELVTAPPEMIRGLGQEPLEAYLGKSDYMLVYARQKDIETIAPDFGLIARLPVRGVIVTAAGNEADFVSRFFAPHYGINEDPATGSAHTTLTPYWANRLGKQELTAMQLSLRGGWLKCKLVGDRVEIAGQAVTYLVGEITVE